MLIIYSVVECSLTKYVYSKCCIKVHFVENVYFMLLYTPLLEVNIVLFPRLHVFDSFYFFAL